MLQFVNYKKVIKVKGIKKNRYILRVMYLYIKYNLKINLQWVKYVDTLMYIPIYIYTYIQVYI